jgi:hypothetical protein
VKIKVAEASGQVLDWMVAMCEGFDSIKRNPHVFDDAWIVRNTKTEKWEFLADLNYSTSWSLGGPIMDREEIDTYCHESPKSGCGWWVAEIIGTKFTRGRGTTRLVAAMRCYVMSKLGDEVEVPDDMVVG